MFVIQRGISYILFTNYQETNFIFVNCAIRRHLGGFDRRNVHDILNIYCIRMMYRFYLHESCTANQLEHDMTCIGQTDPTF